MKFLVALSLRADLGRIWVKSLRTVIKILKLHQIKKITEQNVFYDILSNFNFLIPFPQFGCQKFSFLGLLTISKLMF